MANFTIDFDSADAMAGLDRLADEAKAALRPAAQAGAQVLYNEVKLRVPVYRGPLHFRHNKTKGGGYWVTPGQLRDSIYQVFSRDNSDTEHVTYHISWNHSKAPHGHWMEFGNSRHPAHPFLRPAFDAMNELALYTAKEVFLTKVEEAMAKAPA